MTFLLSTIYPSALAGVIISLPLPTFHCMFSWLPLLPCTSCLEGTKIKRSILSLTLQTAAFWTGPAMHCSVSLEIYVKREHGQSPWCVISTFKCPSGVRGTSPLPPSYKMFNQNTPTQLMLPPDYSPGKEKLLLRAGILHLWRASLWKLNTGRILKNCSIIS